jgi:hypothetical protein
MWQVVPLVFAAGVLSRVTDMAADDGLRLDRRLVLSAGALYGIIAGYVVASFPALAELGVAVLISVLAAGKIDHPGHRVGVIAMLAAIALLGMGPLSLPLLALFVAGGALDELGNGLADSGRLDGVLGRFFRLRLTLDLLALAASAVTGSWLLLAAALAYDAGFTYAFPDRFKRKLISFMGQD